uniref:Uncharacterized protein n=1 Tax=Magallana gigas TaxID=29159 RepID=K1PXP9_MAGGI
MDVSVCLEPGHCDLDVSILDQVLIPILNCDLTMDFDVKGFSLSNWMSEQGLSFDECPANIDLPKLRGTTACHIKNTCTAIKCCVEVGRVSRTFEVELDIDFCNQKLTFAVEKLTDTISLQGFEYGKRREIVIKGVVKLWYTIWDHKGEGVYVVTMDLAVCFEDGGDCLINTNVLDQAKLSKQTCVWGTSFLNPNFSLEQFMRDSAISTYDQIKGLALDKLKEALGLPTFLDDPPCSMTAPAYTPNVNGIKKVCSKDLSQSDSSLPLLPSNMVCQITESCTGIDCCTRADPIHHNLHAYLDIDPCNFKIKFGIDKFQFEIYMQDFEFGIEKDVRLVNVVRIKFQIWDLSAENQYVVNLRFSVCFDLHSSCVMDKVIFDEKRLPKSVCEFASAAETQNFSLEEWKASLDISMDTLLPTLTDQLMEHLGIAGYLSWPQCSLANGTTSTNGWIDGKKERFWLQEFIKIEYTIEDLMGADRYMVDIKVEICLEKDKPCMISKEITKDLYLPKLGCDWSLGFSRFSLSDWYKKVSVPVGSFLTATHLSLLREALGITNFLLPKDQQCSRMSSDYKPETSGQLGWKIDCQESIDKMTEIATDLPLSCHIKHHCTAIECCLDLQSPLQQTIHFFIDLDLCLQTLKLGIENLMFETTLLAYKYDFSLKNWYKDIGANINSTLSKLSAAKLLEELGISKYTQDPQCQRSGPVYSPHVNGWKSDCQMDVLTNPISDSVTCLIKDTCTAVSCCMDIDFLQRSFESYITIDACNQWIHVGIEKLSFNISFDDFPFGRENKFYLNSVIRLDSLSDRVWAFYTPYPPIFFLAFLSRLLENCTTSFIILNCSYKVEDLKTERQFRVSATLKACFESSGDNCLVDLAIFKNTLVPKKICDWTEGFSTANFSLSQWYQDLSLTHGSMLSQLNRDNLLDHLGIRSYLNKEPCSFTSNCKENLDSSLPALPSSVRCSIPDYCTGVTCCVAENSVLRHHFTVGVQLDDCNHILTFEVEKLKIEIALNGYNFGMTEKRYLMSVLHFEFRIDDIPHEKHYKISASLKVCYGIGPCALDTIALIQDFKLPKTLCEWGTGFLSEFSLEIWLRNKGLDMKTALSSLDASSLLSSLGVSEFLKDPQCSRTSSSYSTSSNGWKNDCQSIPTLPPLPGSVSCHIPDSCTSIDCCAEVAFLGGRSINVQVLMDPCEAIMSLNIEKMQYNITLFDYNFGTTDHFTLQGALRIDFNIQNLIMDRKYLLNMNLSVCMETSDLSVCVYSIVIFHNTILPKQLCSMEMPYLNPSFDLSSWKTTLGFGSLLTHEQTKLLLRELGVEEYVGVGCSRNSVPYFPQTQTGWNTPTACKARPPILTSNSISCHINASCTGISCCFDDDITGLTYQISVTVDSCEETLVITLEKMKFEISLFDYPMGTKSTAQLFGILQLEYKIDFISAESAFLFNIKFSACFETKGDCMLNIPILKDVKIPILACNFSLQQFAIPKSSCSQDISSYIQTLPANTNCGISSGCMAIQCCTDLALIGRTLNYSVNIDVCEHSLSLQIETFQFQLSLVDFQFGDEHVFGIDQIFSLRYKIRDLSGQGQYLVDLKLSVCFSDGAPCQMEVIIVSNYLVTKPACAWFNGYKIADFSYSSWLSINNLKPTDILSYGSMSKLIETLGLQKYMKKEACNTKEGLYRNSYQGWTSEVKDQVVDTE